MDRNQTFEQLIESQRRQYIDAFKLVESRIVTSGKKYYVEPLDEYINQANGTTSELFNFFRHDLIVDENGNYYQISVDISPLLLEKDDLIDFKDIKLLVKSFTWNACRIEFGDILPIQIREMLHEWYLVNINLNISGNHDLNSVLHSLELSNDYSFLIIDFGSLEYDSVNEFFSIFSKANCGNLIVSAQKV